MLKELIEKRKRLHEENVALLVKAKQDGRDTLNPDEETEWQGRDAAYEAVTRQIERYQKQAAIEQALAEPQARQVEPAQPATEPRTSAVQSRQLQRGQADLEMAMRAWFLAPKPSLLTEEHRAAAKRVGVDLNSREFTFNLVTRAPRTQAQVQEVIEARAQTITTTGGGYAIPNEMMASFERALLWFGGMRQAATILRTESGAPLPFPMANDTGNVGAILAINTQVSNQDVAFSQLVLGAFKYSSLQVLVPIELMQDNAINLPQVLGEMLGERIGRIQNTHFTTGAGTTLPFGVVTQAVSGLAPTGSVAGGFTYAHLVDTEHSVDIAYRRMGAAWMMSDVVVARLKKLVDTTGRPIWQPYFEAGINSAPAGGSPGAPGTLLGYPVFVNNDVASTQTNGTRAVIFGALQKYLIRDVIGITIVRLDERYADFHQVAFLAFARADGNLKNAGTNPVKFLAYTT